MVTTTDQRTELYTAIDGMLFGAWVEVDLTNSKMCIEHRPPYCDRGRFLWHCESKDNKVMTIDGGDRFPRYLFGTQALVYEILAWCEKRGQTITAMSVHGAH